MKKIKNFFKGVKKEGKATRWPDGKTLTKYSVITIILLVLVGLFFYASDVIIGLVIELVKTIMKGA